MAACGLDFGTSNTAIALPDGTVLPISPGYTDPRLYRSVIFFPEDEREVWDEVGVPADRGEGVGEHLEIGGRKSGRSARHGHP